MIVAAASADVAIKRTNRFTISSATISKPGNKVELDIHVVDWSPSSQLTNLSYSSVLKYNLETNDLIEDVDDEVFV